MLSHEELDKVLSKRILDHEDLILIQHHLDEIGKLYDNSDNIPYDVDETLMADCERIVDRLNRFLTENEIEKLARKKKMGLTIVNNDDNITSEVTMEEQLINEFKTLAGRMSYFNAAEGSWSSEATARGECTKAFRAKADELMKLGHDEESLKELVGGNLVSRGDYITPPHMRG